MLWMDKLQGIATESNNEEEWLEVLLERDEDGEMKEVDVYGGIGERQ